MITVYSEAHQQHNPPYEFVDGRLIPFTEAPRRAETIRRHLESSGRVEFMQPNDYGLAPIQAIHTADYLEFMRGIYDRWCANGGPTEAALPAIFPRYGLNRPSPSPYAQVGQYCFDMSVPFVAGTYAAALASANCALTGAELLTQGAASVYALCRPPGHHAYAHMAGGFCYINNAAVAAQDLLNRGAKRVAILDIDVHHGNGTQHIFYERADVLFVSLHGAPDWEYPFFAGWGDEHGEGEGEGYNINYPLAVGTGDAAYLEVLGDALQKIASYQPDYVVLSAGFDTYEADPLSRLKLTTPCYETIGQRVRALNVPTLILQEGGYMVDDLGKNALSLIMGFEANQDK